MKILLLSAALLFSTLFLFSCKKDNPIPPEDQPQINLTLEDTSCTEAWLKLTTANINLPAEVSLKQDDSIIQNIILSSTDTLLYVDSLLPNHSYKFQSVIQSVNQESDAVNVTTMDTTSHNFTFETFTFGGTAGSSTLYDVAIIDENDIWAVGEIYVADTSQNGYTLYNAVHWDGSQWQLKKISMLSSCNPVTFPPLKAICAFSDSNIIITSGGSIGWFNGVTNTPDCGIRPLLTGTINKLWGAYDNDFYAVGNSGNIAHYQNGQWSRIESGTTVDLLDIWGTSGGKIIWISGYADFKPTVLLKISNSAIETIFNTRDYLFVFDPKHISGGIGSVWTNNDRFVYLTTWYSLYRKSINSDSAQATALISGSVVEFFGLRSRGTAKNNIFTIGSQNSIHHYNGITFRTFQEPTDTDVTYYGLDVKSNTAAICGQLYENGISDKAIISITK